MRAALLVVLAACGAPPEPKAPVAPLTAQPGVLAQLEASSDLDGVPVGASDARATLLFVFASWCTNCEAELPALQDLPDTRLLGINYRGHEEYDNRGSSEAIHAFHTRTPWLRIVPIGDDLFTALGRPPTIPTLYLFDHRGTLVHTFDRRTHRPPTHAELTSAIASLSAPP
jgi:hypothetical protein